jgi:gliding motility-associatede transport system auxiliary component
MKARRRLRLAANWALMVYTAAALAVLLGAANLIIFDHNVRWDLTPGRRYSLSGFDKRVLSSLSHNVTVMAFVRTEDPSYLKLADLLFRVAAFTPRVSYRIIDINKAPALARRWGVTSYGQVVVESEGRRRDFDNARPDLLIPAILRVSRSTRKHIYFTTGHGERDLFDTDPVRGYSEWRNLLEQNNYRIDSLPPLAGGVPDDAAVVVSLGPRKSFLAPELVALAKYLARGGHLLVLIDPDGSPNLVEFLKRYGLDFTDRVIVDPAYRLTGGEMLTAEMPIVSSRNPITRSMMGPAVFSMARGVEVSGKPGEHAPGGLVFVRGDCFLKSSRESFGSGDLTVLTTGRTQFKAGRDVRGPIAVGSEVDLAPGSDTHLPVDRMARIVGLGNSAFVSNRFLTMLGNRDLAVSAVNELAGDEILIASRERLSHAAGRAFYFTDRQARRVLYLGAFGEPAMLFAIGIGVFARRRFFT